MAADTFQIKRGTTAAVNAYLPAIGEPVYDITLKQLRIGDGVTMGGLVPANSSTADKLTNARDIALTGDVTGTVSFDGSANVSMATSLGAAVQATIDSKAPIASPTFTGVPAVPTAAVDTNTTQIASTAFVVGQAGSATPVMDGAGAVGTSLRYARQDHVHPTDTTRAPLESPALTGTPTAPTAAAGTSTTQLATTAFVTAADNLKAPLASPTFTGTPLAPTAAVGTNTTQIATTAMVQAEIANKRTWTSYTPTVTANSGTYTTASATGSYMVEFGICHVRITVTITTKGTGSLCIVTLPQAALAGSANSPLFAKGSAVNFVTGAAVISVGLNSLLLTDYLGADIITGNGVVVNIAGSYPVA